jgi:hypothetical protein
VNLDIESIKMASPDTKKARETSPIRHENGTRQVRRPSQVRDSGNISDLSDDKVYSPIWTTLERLYFVFIFCILPEELCDWASHIFHLFLKRELPNK